MAIMSMRIIAALVVATTGRVAADETDNLVAVTADDEGVITLTGTGFEFVSPIDNETSAVQMTSIEAILQRLTDLESRVAELEAFRETAMNSTCEANEAMIGIDGDGMPRCVGPLQRQLETPSAMCPEGSVLKGYDLITGSSTCVTDMHFTGTCSNGSALSGVDASGGAECFSVTTPEQLEMTAERVIRTAADLVNTTVVEHSDAMFRCAADGLTYDKTRDVCEPPFIHTGCPSTVSGRGGVCSSGVDYESVCQAYCPTGTHVVGSAGATSNYSCTAYATWNPTESPLTCVAKRECPANSTPRPVAADVPGCDCTTGYRGSTTWDFGSSTFVDTPGCVQVPCVGGAGTFPNCECPGRFQGSVSWNAEAQQWNLSACTPLPCPAHASGAPNCVCDSAYFGTLTFTGTAWTGTCALKRSQQVCTSSGGEGRWAHVRCPSGLKIKTIDWACYGRYASCGGSNCGCGRTITSHGTVRSRCLGNTGCDILASNGWWGDPCGGHGKPVVLRVTCTNY